MNLTTETITTDLANLTDNDVRVLVDAMLTYLVDHPGHRNQPAAQYLCNMLANRRVFLDITLTDIDLIHSALCAQKQSAVGTLGTPGRLQGPWSDHQTNARLRTRLEGLAGQLERTAL